MQHEKPNLRKEQAAETRRRLISSAEKLFAEKGYSATPVRQINKSIGMADGLLYHYFPGGKKEILQVIVREKFEQIVHELRRRPAEIDELPLEDAIEWEYQSWAILFEEHKDVIKILFKENEVMQLIEREKLSEVLRRGEKWLPQFLQRRAEKGELREMDFLSAAEVLAAVLMNHFLALLTGAGAGILSDAEHRKRLIAYQVDLWKNPQQ